MKKKISVLMAAGVLSAAMSATVFAGGHHGGGHHGGWVSVSTDAAVSAVSVCAWEDCLTIGEHYHDGSLATHYYGDGHDFHDEYDHYYGDGHDYHDGQAFHSGGYHC